MNEIFPNLPVEMVERLLTHCSDKDIACIRQVKKSVYADQHLKGIAYTRFLQHNFWKQNLTDMLDGKLAKIIQELRTAVVGKEHQEEQAKSIVKDLVRWRESMPTDFHTAIKESYSLFFYNQTFKFSRGYLEFIKENKALSLRKLDSQLRWDWWKSFMIFIMAHLVPLGLGTGAFLYSHEHRKETLIPLTLVVCMILIIVYRDKFSNLGHHFRADCCRRKTRDTAELIEIVINKDEPPRSPEARKTK